MKLHLLQHNNYTQVEFCFTVQGTTVGKKTLSVSCHDCTRILMT